MLARLRERNRLGDRVVHRRAAARLDPVQRLADAPAIGRPLVHQLRRAVEPIEEHLVFRPEQVEQEAVQRHLRGRHLLAAHAAAGVEDDPETHRHALGVEMGDRLRLIVLVDAEVLLAQARDEPAVAVGDGRGHVDQFDAGAEAKRLLILVLLREERGGSGGQQDCCRERCERPR